jgi:hypothetical protein
MANTVDHPDSPRARNADIAWRAVCAGYAIAVLGTLAMGGGGILFATKGMWWVAVWGTLSLFFGALAAGIFARTAEPLNGAFIAVFYFATVALTVFVGEFLAVLPDPLPGLPRGDSTFFFVWPLAQLASGTLGAVVGGWLYARRRGSVAE